MDLLSARRARAMFPPLAVAAAMLPAACATAMPRHVEPGDPAVVERTASPDTAGLPLGEPIPLPPRVAAASVLASVRGEATYYATRFDGRRTASGVVFRNAEPWAAHPDWPFGTRVRVTNLANDRSTEVIIVDRGPHGATARRRNTIIDVSQSAARALDFIRDGRTPVLVEVLEWGRD